MGIGFVQNARITTSLGETIAIAVKRQKPVVVNAVTIEVGIAEAAANAETTEVATVEVVEIAVVAGVIEVATVEVVVANAETTEVATAGAVVKEVSEITTSIVHLVANIVEATIADLAEIPENLVVGGPKARAAPASAEISRGAFI